jgi:hypothetical protein
MKGKILAFLIIILASCSSGIVGEWTAEEEQNLKSITAKYTKDFTFMDNGKVYMEYSVKVEDGEPLKYIEETLHYTQKDGKIYIEQKGGGATMAVGEIKGKTLTLVFPNGDEEKLKKK